MFLPEINASPLYRWKTSARLTGWLRLEGTSGDCLVQCPAQGRSSKAGCLVRFWMSSFSYWEAVHRALQVCQVERKDHLLAGTDLPAMLFQRQPWVLLAFCAADSRSTCCQPGAPGSSLQSCFPISRPPTKARGRAVHFPLLTSLMFLSTWSSSLSEQQHH